MKGGDFLCVADVLLVVVAAFLVGVGVLSVVVVSLSVVFGLELGFSYAL